MTPRVGPLSSSLTSQYRGRGEPRRTLNRLAAAGTMSLEVEDPTSAAACNTVVRNMEAKKEIMKIPYSDDTIKNRIIHLSDDTEKTH